MEIVNKISVRFCIPKIGFIDEIYDLENENDVIAWHSNQKYYAQISFKNFETKELNNFEAEKFIEKITKINISAKQKSKHLTKEI